jgi:uncharacterized protein YkwD
VNAQTWRVARATAILLSGLALGAAQSRTINLEQRLLASHNHERGRHGIAPLVWDAGLARHAEVWADELAAEGKFHHSPTGRNYPFEGENIWGGTPDSFTPEAMVGLWIREKGHYVEGTFPRNSITGRVEDVSHYTQVMWRQTRAVGCALSRGAKEEILVCRYSEPGNVRGYRPF